MTRNALLARLSGQPILLDAAADAEALFAHAAQRVVAMEGRLADDDIAADAGFWPPAGHWMNAFRPYNVVGGVLTVPVKGLLMADFPFADGGWATGYEYIAAAVRRGAADEAVHTILLDVNSGGGYVTDCFACADTIHEAGKAKRVVASVQDHAYSAAYALASQADEIVVAETGGVGSVGVVTYHIDASGAYEQMGLVKTYLHAGKFKVDGNETEPLTKTARARIEKRLQATYDVFVRAVARGRAMKEEDVRATEALTYTALDGIEVGFADRIGNHIDAISAAAPATTTQEEDEDMAEKQATFTQEDLDAAVAAARAEERASAAAVEESAFGAGATAECARIAAILGSEEAKVRPAAAHQAAFVLGLDAAKAATFLAAMPVEVKAESETAGAAAPKGMFGAAMDASEESLSAGVPGASDVNPDTAAVENVFHLLGRSRA